MLSHEQYNPDRTTLTLDFRMIEKESNDQIEASDKASDKASFEALNEGERNIIFAIKDNPRITQDDISKHTEYSRSKVQRIMKGLTERGIIQREGSKKNGAWVILSDDDDKDVSTE